MGIEDFELKFGGQKVAKKKKEISRREFLKKSAKAAAGVIAGGFGAELLEKCLDKKEEPHHSLNINKQHTNEQLDIAEPSVKEAEASTKQSEINKPDENKEKNLADIYLQAYYDLSKSAEYWPGDIFTNDLLIAQQLQESKFNKQAVSPAGAHGIMQNMRISVRDVVRYLNKLKRKGRYNYAGPASLNDQQLAQIMELIKAEADYSRAFGKLYFIMLWDKDNGYKVGRAHYYNGDIEGAQKELLAAYNGGYRRVRGKPERLWPKESREYWRKIFNYKEIIKDIRAVFKENNINPNNDYAVMLVSRKIDEVKDEKDKKLILDKYVRKIKQGQVAQGRALADEELRQLMAAS